MQYDNLDMKIPNESSDYSQKSNLIIDYIDTVMKEALDSTERKISLDTNIIGDFPLDNVNKIAAPLIESWAFNIFRNNENKSKLKGFELTNVEAATGRTDLADIILQFENKNATANVDVKSTADSIKKSGKGPNITSFAKIRSAYILDPDFIFIILSLRYNPYAVKSDTNEARAILEIKEHSAYDFKYLDDNDFVINSSLGTGQIQINDIHYVRTKKRTVAELVELLDDKYLNSSKTDRESWLRLAKKYDWIKNEPK